LKALFITGNNQYGVASHFLNGMQQDFASSGIESIELSLHNAEAIAHAEQQLKSDLDYDIVISFNGLGLDIVDNGQRILEECGKPLYIFLVDHPLHLLPRFLGTKGTVLCVDKEHVTFCQLCGIKALFFPHAISAELMKEEAIVPEQEKSNEWLFPVSFFDVSHWREKLAPTWANIAPLVNQSQSVTRFMQLVGVLPLGKRPPTLELNNNVLQICRMVDYYLRAKARQDCLVFFAQQGHKLTVIGKGVQRYQSITDFHDYQPAIDSDALLTRIKQAKFVVHNSPGFELGLHERIVQPMALGTHVITYDAGYVKHVIGDGVFLPTSQQAPHVDTDYYNGFAASNREAILSRHSWKVRFNNLLSIG
tara:strand:+ start:10497 stop:11588 length:1092 start_codon:yes stop_codon:yes gene_type:complete